MHISTILQPWNTIDGPSNGQVRSWMTNLYTKFQPLENARWNNSYIDTLFHAGEQSFVNRHFSFSPKINFSQYYFNLIQQPCNLVTGFQRQHTKSTIYQASDGGDPHTTDQYTRLMMNTDRKEGTDLVFSKSCELSTVAGMNLLQPYLDFTEDDPLQGSLKVKLWEFQSFLVDPFFRQPDMSDARFVWTQEFISKEESYERFGDAALSVSPYNGNSQTYSTFYFLPENYYITKNDMYVLSYVWYKSRTKRKRLYSRKRNQFFDYAGGDDQLEQILYHIDDMEPVEVMSPCWKVATVLNDQLMYHGVNPLWDGSDCPFIPNFWNYAPHISTPELRSTSLVFSMRSPQFLANYKIIQNNDIAAATINAGWKRKIGAVHNEENLKMTGQGYDIIINSGFELTDIEKIVPSAVPESDLALADQMINLIFKTSGIEMENWSGQDDKQISYLTMVTKQAANLLVFQKYFDQWDYSLKLLGERKLQYVLKNWSKEKVELLLGEEASPFFYSRIFSKYHTVVLEGLNTPTQRNMAAQQKLDMNAAFGREVFPPSMIIKDLNIQDKAECMQFLQQQEEQMSTISQEETTIKQTFDEAKLQELYSKVAANLATARERQGRAEADIGLFEERLSEISHNRAMSIKAKVESLEKLIAVLGNADPQNTMMALQGLDAYEQEQVKAEDVEKLDAKITASANDFKMDVLNSVSNDTGFGNQS